MTAFLLIISFILNIIALLGVIILYSRQNRMLQLEKTQKESIKEMEDIISSFAAEMKEDNELLFAKISQTGSEHKKPEKILKPENKDISGALADNISDKPNAEKNAFSRSLTSKAVKNKTAISAYRQVQKDSDLEEPGMLANSPIDRVEISGKPNTEKDNNDHTFKSQLKKNMDMQSSNDNFYMDSVLKQALALRQAGLSIEQIAKKLNKGKTEIELLLKFRSEPH